MKLKQLHLLFLLYFTPKYCYASELEEAADLILNLFLFTQFSLTALSFILCIIFYKKQKGSTRTIAIIISIFLTLIASSLILTAKWDLEGGEMYEKDMALKQLEIGYWILIPNLIVLVIAPFIKLIKSKVTKVNLKS